MLTLEERSIVLMKTSFGWGGGNPEYKGKYDLLPQGTLGRMVDKNKYITNNVCPNAERWGYSNPSAQYNYCEEYKLPFFNFEKKNNLICKVEADLLPVGVSPRVEEYDIIHQTLSLGTHALAGHYLRNNMLATRHTCSPGDWTILHFNEHPAGRLALVNIINIYLYLLDIDIAEYTIHRTGFLEERKKK